MAENTKRVSLNQAELSIVEKTRRLVKLHAKLRRLDAERVALLTEIVEASTDVTESMPRVE